MCKDDVLAAHKKNTLKTKLQTANKSKKKNNTKKKRQWSWSLIVTKKTKKSNAKHIITFWTIKRVKFHSCWLIKACLKH